MKNWTTRLFALLAVATVFGSALMVGCGGGSDESTDNTVNTANNAKTEDMTKPE